MPDAARLRISLLDIDPVPWRSIEVPLSLSLKALHDCVQAVFLWHNSHLWQFEVDGRCYSDVMESFSGFDDPNDRIYKAANVRLERLFQSGRAEFLYIYDMGDNWEHLIEVEALFDAEPETKLPRYLGGEWAAPPEDCGGAPGYAHFRDAMADPKHPDHEELMDWYEGPFDPAFVDTEQIQVLISRIARRRRKR